MVPFHVFATCQLRLPRESLRRQPPLGYFPLNEFRPVEPPSCLTAPNKPLAINRLHTLQFSVCSTAPNNPFGIIRFRTLSRHNGGIGVSHTKNLKHHFNFPAPSPDPCLLSPFFSYSCELFCTHQTHNSFLFNRFHTLWQKHPGVGGTAATARGACLDPVGALRGEAVQTESQIERKKGWRGELPTTGQIQRAGGASPAPTKEGKDNRLLPRRVQFHVQDFCVSLGIGVGGKIESLPHWENSLRDDAVGPLHQADKNCGTAEFGSPLIQICFRDPTGPAAGPSRKDGNVFGHNFFKRFTERRPAHGHDRIHRRLSHQIGGLSREENLHFVTGVRQRESMQKGKRRPGRVIGAPGTLHHDFESFLFWLLGLCAKGKKRQSQ